MLRAGFEFEYGGWPKGACFVDFRGALPLAPLNEAPGQKGGGPKGVFWRKIERASVFGLGGR
jgi:hypothetical protein